LQVVAPQRGGVALRQIAAQEIAPFAPTRLPQLLTIEGIAERGEFGVDLDFDQASSGRRFGFGLSEFDQEFVARQVDGHPV
jgi:hypothetical protein